MRVLVMVVLSIFALLTPARASELTRRCGDIKLNLTEVFANPIAFAGARFCGYAYTYRYDWETGAVFYPTRVRNDADMAKFQAELLPGERSQSLSGLKSGDKVLISGELDPDKTCWLDSSCVPWTHPIFLNDLRVLNVITSH